MRTHKIAAIPGDGIGKEVISAGLEVLTVLAQCSGEFELDIEHFDWGSDRYKTQGALMPEDGAEQLKAFDAMDRPLISPARGWPIPLAPSGVW